VIFSTEDTKNGPLLCEVRGLSTGRNYIRQSFSRLRLITPRLNLYSGMHLQPCLVAPTIDGASRENPTPLLQQRPHPLLLAAQKRVTYLEATDLSRLKPPPSVCR